MAILESMQTGSRVMCSPAPTDTDNDIVLLVTEETLQEELDDFEKNGFVYDSKYNTPGNNFFSMRKDDLNYIVTASKDFYDRFVNATKLCKKLNLLNKQDRVTLFEAVLYGTFPNETIN